MATTSDRRSSMSSIRSAISRSSVPSDEAMAPQLGPYRPTTPLTAGSSISGPPPVVPPKDRIPPPMTPKRKPVQHQKSPLSSEAFSSPASVMPGTFPDTPPAQSTDTTDSAQPTHASKGAKRLSSMRSFLPFKSLRKSYDNTSPDTPGFRPTTPGADSLSSSARPPSSAGSRPSLRKKMSGQFWKRKSSLGMSFTAGSRDQDDSEDIPRGPETYDTYDDTIMEDSRPATPAIGDDSPLPIKKRKSGTFWRRKSSLTLAETMNAERQGWGRKSSEIGKAVNGHGSGTENGNGNGVSRVDSAQLGRQASKRSEIESEPESPPPPPRKSYSPPPQLPEFVGAGGGLGMDDDFFKGIS